MNQRIDPFLNLPVVYYDEGKLDTKTVRAMKPAERTYRVADGRGMFVEITPTGSKRWRLAYRFAGKQKLVSLGLFPDVSLAAARRAMSECKALLREGYDPAAVRRESREAKIDTEHNTFGNVTAAWLAKMAPSWAPATTEQNRGRLEANVLPYLDKRPIREIKPPEILAVVQRIVDRGAIETARRNLRLIRQICAFAVVTGKLDANPASDLAGALPSVKAKHMPALVEPDQVAGLLRAIDGYMGEPVVRAALQLAPLVFVRPGELRAARWEEFDLDAGRWEIPADRMKMGEPLVVPLSRQALAILADLRPLSGDGELLFPSTRSKARPISNNTLNAALRRMGFTKDEVTAHGFRAMARTMLEEQLGFRYELIEQQLGHVVRDPNGRAYNRTRHVKERATMMTAWGDYLERLKGEGGNVRELAAVRNGRPK